MTEHVSATMFPSLPRADFTVLLTYQKKINISTKNTVTTFYQRSYIVISNYLYNAIKKCRKKMYRRQFKVTVPWF